MQVENENDRQEMPDECDVCGSSVPLERFQSFGPGHHVDWLCSYCANDFTHGQNSVVKSIAAMLNKLEERLKSNAGGESPRLGKDA